jgi:hypothetical protein
MPTQEHDREREIKHIATGTNPQPGGWTTPSSSWWPPGWWRWIPVMISPFGRVPEQGLDWFFVATEACDGGTSNVGLFLGVSVFIGFFSISFTRRWASRGPPPTRVCRGVARLGVLWVERGLWWFFAPLFLFSSKKSSKSFVQFWELLFLHKKQHHGSSTENSVSPG